MVRANQTQQSEGGHQGKGAHRQREGLGHVHAVRRAGGRKRIVRLCRQARHSCQSSGRGPVLWEWMALWELHPAASGVMHGLRTHLNSCSCSVQVTHLRVL